MPYFDSTKTAIGKKNLLPRVRVAVEGAGKRRNLAAFTVGGAVLLAQSILILPWSFYPDLMPERAYGLTNLTTDAWLIQYAVGAIAGALIGGLLFIPLYAIIRRTGARWWIWGCALAAVALLFPRVDLFGARGIEGIADPAGIPVLLAISAVFTLLTTPLVNSAMRVVETDADAYGLDLAREPDGAARALLATTSYRAPDPTELEEALFYDHPSIESRLRMAMEWKASHPGSQ